MFQASTILRVEFWGYTPSDIRPPLGAHLPVVSGFLHEYRMNAFAEQNPLHWDSMVYRLIKKASKQLRNSGWEEKEIRRRVGNRILRYLCEQRWMLPLWMYAEPAQEQALVKAEELIPLFVVCSDSRRALCQILGEVLPTLLSADLSGPLYEGLVPPSGCWEKQHYIWLIG